MAYGSFRCRTQRRYLRAENLTKAERLRFGRPLRSKPGCRPVSVMSGDHPLRTHGPYSEQFINRDRRQFQ